MDIALSRGRITGIGVLAVGCILVFAATGHATGPFTTLGYENRSIRFAGYGSATGAGGGFGLKRMYFSRARSISPNTAPRFATARSGSGY